MHTGVLKEYRGRKIALALKLLAIRYSRACGAALLRTDNDSQNASILAINEKLGDKPQSGYFRCVRGWSDFGVKVCCRGTVAMIFAGTKKQEVVQQFIKDGGLR